MFKKSIAILFALLVMVLLLLPSVIVALDDSFDTSLSYSLSEEEISKDKNIVSPFLVVSTESKTKIKFKTKKSFSFKFRNYSKPHLNLIFPPPKHTVF